MTAAAFSRAFYITGTALCCFQSYYSRPWTERGGGRWEGTGVPIGVRGNVRVPPPALTYEQNKPTSPLLSLIKDILRVHVGEEGYFIAAWVTRTMGKKEKRFGLNLYVQVKKPAVE